MSILNVPGVEIDYDKTKMSQRTPGIVIMKSPVLYRGFPVGVLIRTLTDQLKFTQKFIPTRKKRNVKRK